MRQSRIASNGGTGDLEARARQYSSRDKSGGKVLSGIPPEEDRARKSLLQFFQAKKAKRVVARIAKVAVMLTTVAGTAIAKVATKAARKVAARAKVATKAARKVAAKAKVAKKAAKQMAARASLLDCRWR